MAHWGNGSVTNELDRTHLASQLYELSETLRRRIGPPEGARVLDAGASDGFFLSRLGVRWGVGVNFLPACARKIHADGYEACLADIEKLPFADKSFDYVVCCETLEHVVNPIHTLNELARVCRQRIFLTVPWLPATRINPRPSGWPQVESHVFEFSEADFMKILTHARVRLRYRESVQVFPEPRNPILQWWLGIWMYPSYFPKLQYYELEPF
jgi:SAM-dependent methyltransferase